MKSIEITEFNEKEIIEGGVPVIVRGRFKALYMLTYGTLKLGEGNWAWALKDTADYIETRQIPGILFGGGLSAEFVGTDVKAEEWCTLDIFKLHDDENFDNVLAAIDRLEGGYEHIAFPIEINGEMVLAKFYQSRIGQRRATSQDRAISLYGSPQGVIANILKKGFTTENTPNLQNYLDYYVR